MSFTPETSAEDAQSVMELHRQMEQSGQLQDRNRAAQLLKTAEDAMMNVQNAQALGLMNAQEGYDTEIGLQKVINNTRAILTDTQNGDTRKTPAQMTAPENNIGGIDNGRAEGINDSTERNAGLGADEQGGRVPQGTGRDTARGRNDSLEIRRAINAGEVDLRSAKSLEQIVKNAILFDTVVSVKDSNSKMENTAFMHSMYSVYEMNGNFYLLKLFVEEAVPNNGGDPFVRAYQLKDIEKIADLPNGVLSEDGGLTDDKSTTFINNLAGLYLFVKRYDGDFTPAKEVNPVLLNDDGTPRVFYHGAKNGGGFEVFKNWQYFTKQEQYAQRYAKRDDPSAMYAVYLTADKVFDTRNADAATITFAGRIVENGEVGKVAVAVMFLTSTEYTLCK